MRAMIDEDIGAPAKPPEPGVRSRWLLLAAAAFSLLASQDVAAQRPRALMGTPAKLARQNRLADDYDLSRMDDPAEVRRLISSGRLVAIPRSGRGYYVDETLGRAYGPRKRTVLFYARPWVLRFLKAEGRRFRSAFPGRRLKVSSLVRTEEYQEILTHRNVNAARGEDPDRRSPHLTGAAVDISKKGMTAREIAWLRRRLVALQARGWIVGTEEMATNTFHIFVTPEYGRVEDRGERDGQ